jgi:predicted enzyme related to lactoylglutathione lyase
VSSHPPIDQTLVFTYTNDLDAASAFFKDVMEFEFVVDQGCCHIFRMTDASFIGVCDLPGRPTGKTALTITIVSNAVDEWYDFLTAKGIEYQKPPGHSDKFGVYSSLFISPHGYRIEIQHFDDPDWHLRRL